VTAEGTVLDASESRAYFSKPGHGTGVDVAVGNDGMMLVASISSYIRLDLMNVQAMPLDLNGNPTASEPVRIDVTPVSAQLGSATVAASGDAFYALWAEETSGMSRVRGTRLDMSGAVVDRFDNGSTEAFTPSATTAPTGEIVIVQSQYDTRQANVVRVFATAFRPGQAAIHRVRSVRR
jgi:hypothetical protein